jgi:hypothetical protein
MDEPGGQAGVRPPPYVGGYNATGKGGPSPYVDGYSVDGYKIGFKLGGYFSSHRSPKKPAAGSPPGYREVTGCSRSTTAQSGSFGVCRALLR